MAPCLNSLPRYLLWVSSRPRSSPTPRLGIWTLKHMAGLVQSSQKVETLFPSHVLQNNMYIKHHRNSPRQTHTQAWRKPLLRRHALSKMVRLNLCGYASFLVQTIIAESFPNETAETTRTLKISTTIRETGQKALQYLKLHTTWHALCFRYRCEQN